MENVSPTESFDLRSEVSQNFKFDGKINCKNIHITDAHWFTLENLMSCDEQKEIQIEDSNFTKTDLRTFLKKWKAGKFPKLKKVQLGTTLSPFDVIKGFAKREDKCVNNWRCWIIAIKGHGDSYGRVYSGGNNPKYFHMTVHND